MEKDKFGDIVQIDTLPDDKNWSVAVTFGKRLLRVVKVPLDRELLARAWLDTDKPTITVPPEKFTWINRLGTQQDEAFVRSLFTAVSSLGAERSRLFPRLFQGLSGLQSEPMVYGWIRMATNDSLRETDREMYEAARIYTCIFFQVLEFAAGKVDLDPSNLRDVRNKLPVVLKDTDSLTDFKFGGLKGELVPSPTNKSVGPEPHV